MAWLSQFLLGRPTNEVAFTDVNPKAMSLDPQNVEVLQRNLAGDLRQSILKPNVPVIKINSDYLTKSQRDSLASLAGIGDTFLSFQCRDDWQVVNELVSIIDLTHIQIANSSITRLSALLVALGGTSIITINTPFNIGLTMGQPYGYGPYGGSPYGGSSFDPGAVTYDDATQIVTLTNALPTTNASLYVTYTYTGWLVKMRGFPHQYEGGWIDRGTYDVELQGA